ncbi:MAG TPA: alanine--tRNA ligase [Planctomycetota bacterium]|nr:alanine--tRNA ligase [Planctomycetota bacterium]
MNANEVRNTFLEFFKEQGHTLVPSSSVIPHGDRTLLFTNAGMNQFKDIFTGRQSSKFPRATTAQKCIRAGGKHNDLDNVGYTRRHLTFFEMLGNFSFGDYFKKDAIAFAWELVTKRFGVSPARLWITVFREDSEARDLWRKVAGVSPDRIVGLGEKDNFWSMGDVGPCGPCSELLVDRGDAYGPADMENGERFFEIWNLVFMQFDQKAGGSRSPLPRPSIDTGMGLERMAMVLQGVDSVYEIDSFQRLIRRVESLTSTRYDPGPGGVPHRVIADHIRSLVFAFADGAEPSNEGRGYVLRRILRRAARYARKIHPEGLILHQLVDDLVEEMGGVYPEVKERREFITRLIRNEEERFGETLDKGIALFEEVSARIQKEGTHTVPGDDVFKLYDTFGFPVDLVERMAQEKGLAVDLPGFERLMKEQKERSRGASQFAVAGDLEDLQLERLPETRFSGYERRSGSAEVQAALEREGVWSVVLSETPFYAESGGQVGDTGRISCGDFVLDVEDTRKERGRFVHRARLVEGDPARLRSGVVVEAAVDPVRRAAIERNHTATHLLHAALRKVAGTHVHQKGSLVEPLRLRFDVTHFSAFEPEELARAEGLVRGRILENLAVETFETDYEDAVRRGAMALFGEKYGDHVRVVKIGDFSLELCGGTHVGRTGDVGTFVLAGEGSVSSGVRRLEALSAEAAEGYHRRNREIVGTLSRTFKVAPEALLQRIEKLIEENRESKAKKPSPAGEPAREGPGGGVLLRERAGKALFLGIRVEGGDAKALREAYDRLKHESRELVLVLFGQGGGKLQTLVAVSPSLVEEGLDAREIFKRGAARLGLRGGGRPELVQAGGADPGKAGILEEALADMLAAVRSRPGGEGSLPAGAAGRSPS